ncbi:hypothetical protein LINPERPRIM_LOCUS32606 [Linum perenne]
MTKEKDKTPSSRFSRQMKQHLHQSAAGDSVTRDKPKKARIIKRLSAVNKASSSFEDSPDSVTVGKKKKKKQKKIHTGMSATDDKQLPSPALTPVSTLNCTGNKKNKRFKLPRKLLDGCNGVGHSTVPRKLRSAMKKRSRESLSPPLTDPQKLLNPATDSEESQKGHDIKRPRLAQKQENICGLITKDEEEVAETLYALAGMFPDGNNDNMSGNPDQLKNVHSDASPSVWKEDDSDVVAPKIKDDLNSVSRTRTDDPSNPTSNVCNSAEEADICTRKILTKKFVKLGGQVNVDKTPVAESKNHMFFSKSTNVFIPLEPALDAERQKLPSKPDNWLLTTAQGHQLDKQLPIKEPKKNGLALWPGLSSALSNGPSSHGSSMQCSPAKVPAWLDAAVSASKVGSSSNVSSFRKVTDRRSWKRSTTHVCISRLIQSLQTLENKDPTELESREMLKPAVLMTLNEFHGTRKGFNGAASTSGSNEARGGFLQSRRSHYYQPNAAVSHAATYNSQEQSFNFMSFLQANSSFNGTANGAGTLSLKPRASYLDQHMQHTTVVMPSFVHQPHHGSSPYPDQTHLQPTTYLGRPLYPPNLSTTTLSNQQLQHQHQQQQAQIQQSQYLAAQLAARYRGAGVSSSAAMTQLSSWQNRKQETAAVAAMPSYVRAIIPRPPSSLEISSPKQHNDNTSMRQHQQLLSVASSLPNARVKRQDHVFSSVFEDTGRGFSANGAVLPLQLLCNERM